MMWKSAVVQRLMLRGVAQCLFGVQIPASIETLTKCAHASRDLIVARVAAKSSSA